MASSVTQILNLIVSKIFTGGRRTTGDNTRQVLNEMANSYLNLKDGGIVNGDLIIPDDEAKFNWKIKISSEGVIYVEKV